MALDSRNNRASALMVALSFGRILPHPDGTVAQADRQQAALVYAGILATAAVVVSFQPVWTFTARARQFVFQATRRGSA